MNWFFTSCGATVCWKASEFAGKVSPAEFSMLTSNRGKSTALLGITENNVGSFIQTHSCWTLLSKIAINELVGFSSSCVLVGKNQPSLPLSLLTDIRCLMPVRSQRDSSLIARRLLRSSLGQLMWTTPSTNLATPRYKPSLTLSLCACALLYLTVTYYNIPFSRCSSKLGCWDSWRR